jgi:hypothetical protein
MYIYSVRFRNLETEYYRMNRLKSAIPSLQGLRTKPVRTGHAGNPERIILSGLSKAGYALFLPLTQFCRIFCYHTHFQYHAIFLAATPHTLKRQEAAKSGKKRPYYTPHSGHGAMITHRTPVSCVTMCNGVQGVGKNMRSLCKSVQ